MLRRGLFGIALALSFAWTIMVFVPSALAQELDARITDRCVRAAVRIVVVGPDGQPIASGSGSLIHPSGYVLTNFHVIGHADFDHGVPGTLFVRSNRYEISLADSARASAQPRYLAMVVRADVRLDLALLRIVSDVGGRPIRRGMRFPSVDIADTSALRPGTRVWAFGYPLGVRTINVTGGQVTGFQMNADRQVAWLRSDAEFNPGNSGGMLVDAHGQIVAIPTAVVHGRATLEPIELARPAERVPRAWITAMRRGIDDVRIDGVPEITTSGEIADASLGDVGGLGDAEVHFFRIGDDLRPARITAVGGAPAMALADGSGQVVRRGQGSIEIGPYDPRALVLAIVAENPSESPMRIRLRTERLAPPPRIAAAPMTPPGVMQPTSAPPAEIPPPFVAVPGGPTATIRGTVLDGATGRPMVDVFVLVGRPGDDLGRAIAMLLDGRLSEDRFFASLAGYARTDANGRYEISGLATNARYPSAAFARDRRPVMLSIAVANEGSVIELNPIAIAP